MESGKTIVKQGYRGLRKKPAQKSVAVCAHCLKENAKDKAFELFCERFNAVEAMIDALPDSHFTENNQLRIKPKLFIEMEFFNQ